MCFHRCPMVPNKVFQVLNVFLKMFPIATTLYPIALAQSWAFTTYKGGPKGSTSILLFGECAMFQIGFFFGGDRPIKIALLQKKLKIENWLHYPGTNLFGWWKWFFWPMNYFFMVPLSGKFIPQHPLLEVIVEFINFIKPPNHQYVPKLNYLLNLSFLYRNHHRKKMTL